jgi:RNA polymerase sigma-70 factor (ECF subfamily)
LRIALLVSFAGDRIAAIEAVADEEALAMIDLEVL